jgi:hypothetical protein
LDRLMSYMDMMLDFRDYVKFLVDLPMSFLASGATGASLQIAASRATD